MTGIGRDEKQEGRDGSMHEGVVIDLAMMHVFVMMIV